LAVCAACTRPVRASIARRTGSSSRSQSVWRTLPPAKGRGQRRAGQVTDTSPDVSPQVRRLRCLPTPDGGSSVTYALSRRAGVVRGSRDAADDLEPGSGVGPAFRLPWVARMTAPGRSTASIEDDPD